MHRKLQASSEVDILTWNFFKLGIDLPYACPSLPYSSRTGVGTKVSNDHDRANSTGERRNIAIAPLHGKFYSRVAGRGEQLLAALQNHGMPANGPRWGPETDSKRGPSRPDTSKSN